MKEDPGFYDYWPYENRPKITWPNGARVATVSVIRSGDDPRLRRDIIQNGGDRLTASSTPDREKQAKYSPDT